MLKETEAFRQTGSVKEVFETYIVGGAVGLGVGVGGMVPVGVTVALGRGVGEALAPGVLVAPTPGVFVAPVLTVDVAAMPGVLVRNMETVWLGLPRRCKRKKIRARSAAKASGTSHMAALRRLRGGVMLGGTARFGWVAVLSIAGV